MECLETEIPAVATELKKGNCLVNKTNPAFFLLHIDHAHEQNNKIVKGDRGAIGLTETSTHLLRWNKPRNIKNNHRFRVVSGIGQECSETRRARRFTPPRAN